MATGITIEYDLPVRMRDGTVLATDVLRPSAPGEHPAILMRTPYGKLGLATDPLTGLNPLAIVRAGYVLVVQDSRGTGGSEGEFVAVRDEARDGSDAISWAASQPWSSGAVGMLGGSYLGAVQFAAASESPPALKTIVASVSYLDDMLYMGGAWRLANNLPWCLTMALGQVERSGAVVSSAREQLMALVADPASTYRRPLQDLRGITPWLDRQLFDWATAPEKQHTWRPILNQQDCSKIAVPAIHIAGWYDFFLGGGLAAYRALRSGAATEEARANQRLILEPAPHGPPAAQMGDLWLGEQALNHGAEKIVLEWFDTWLKGAPLVARDPVRLFVAGANTWRDESDWPPPTATPTRLYLRSGGSLSREPPGDEPSDEFLYDPHDPVPTVSGQVTVPGPDGVYVGGPRDRRRVHGRRDVLLYTSELLLQDIEVTGPVTATLHVASSALDTDFTAGLLDVFPDGGAIGLTDGILRLRYRNGLDRAVPLQPGAVCQIEVDLVATSTVFFAGHRIAVEISSSNFPRFDRNPNHGGVIADATAADFIVAHQRVFHDGNRASHVTLPIVPR